jgi:hypothetical protein
LAAGVGSGVVDAFKSVNVSAVQVGCRFQEMQ